MPMLVPDMACGSRCFGHCGDFLQGAHSWPYAPFLVKLEELIGAGRGQKPSEIGRASCRERV